MNLLGPTQRTQVIAGLVAGNSIRATVRVTGVAKNTFVKLLATRSHFTLFHYNVCRVHQTLRVTPAIEAGQNHVWNVEEIVDLLSISWEEAA